MAKYQNPFSHIFYSPSMFATTYNPDGRQVYSATWFGQIVNHGKVRALQVPRNDHEHPEDRIMNSYTKQLNLAFDKDEVKRLMVNPNLMVRFNKCLERGGLETPTAYILRLIDILKTLDGLESVDDEQKQKTIAAIKKAYSQFKKD